MNLLKLYLLFILTIGINLLEASSYCKQGFSVEIRKGKDICYKYNKKTDRRIEMNIESPDNKSQWRLFIDAVGLKDIWKK